MNGLFERFALFFWSAPGTPFPSEQELFAGVEKPTTTIAKMIAADILTDVFKPVGNAFESDKGYLITWSETTEGRRQVTPAELKAAYKRLKKLGYNPGQLKASHEPTGYNWRVEDQAKQSQVIKKAWGAVVSVDGLTFSKEDRNIVGAAVETALSLYQQRLQNVADSANQQKAVDFLSQWLGVSRTEPEQTSACSANEPHSREAKFCGTEANTKTTKKKQRDEGSSRIKCHCDPEPGMVCLCPIPPSV